jgi:hypothetical protein
MRAWARIGAVAVAVATLGATASTAAAYAPSGMVPDVPTGTPGPQLMRAPGAPNLDWQGGPVMHTNHVYVIYWNPSNCTFNSAPCAYDAGYQSVINGFLANVAADSHKASNVYALTGQYGDSTGRAFYDSTFEGGIQDSDPVVTNGCTLPPPPPVSTGPGWTTCVSNAQLRDEVVHVTGVDHLPTGIGTLYLVVMPNGFGSCFTTGPNSCSVSGFGTVSTPVSGSFCGFHTATGTVGNPTLYADIPYNALSGHCRSDNPRPNGNSADPTLSSLSHEHNETITDPLPLGVGNQFTGWVQNSDGQEIGDLCASSFGSVLGSTSFGAYNEMIGRGRYVLQGEWSNEDAGGSCQQRDEVDPVSVSGPSSGVVDEPTSFSGSASDPDGSISTFVWNFGDGSALAGGTHLSHTFSRAGTFSVTLSIQDVAGQRASTTRTIRISNPGITRISSTKARHKATLSVSVNAPGTVHVGGTSKVLRAAGTAKFKIALGAKGRSKLSRRGVQMVKVKVKVTFLPLRGGAAETRTTQVTFRG